VGRNRPAEGMPVDGMVRRYFTIYNVNLLLITNECDQRRSTDYALGVAHNTSHIRQLLPTFPACLDSDSAAYWHVLGRRVQQAHSFSVYLVLSELYLSCCWMKIAPPVPTCNSPFTHISCVMSTISSRVSSKFKKKDTILDFCGVPYY
jgi:hypothetical protein